MKLVKRNDSGVVSGLLVAVIGLGILVLAAGSFAIWAFVNYNDAKSNVQNKIDLAVADAKKQQSDTDFAVYAREQQKQTETFKAPDVYCGLSFQYPKAWSVYWSEQTDNGGPFRAFLNPGYVPAISDKQQFAIRVLIEPKDFNSVTSQYNDKVQSGDLTMSTGSANGQPYTRFSGDFTRDIRGDAVIFQCRDKTITVRTDAKDTFRDVFTDLVQSIKFNP